MAEQDPNIAVQQEVLAQLVRAMGQQQQLAGQAPKAQNTLLEPGQSGVMDAVMNPSQAQLNAGIAGILGALNPNSRAPIASGLATGLSALVNERGRDLSSRQAAYKLETEALQQRIENLTKVSDLSGNLGTAQRAINTDRRAEDKTYKSRTQFNATIPGVGTQLVQKDDFGNYYDTNGNRINLPEGTQLFQAGKTDADLGYKVPSGYMLADPQNPSKGVVEIPGGPKTKLSPEQAGKAAMVQVARDNHVKIDSMLFKPDGSVDRVMLGESAVNLPWSEGRTMRSMIKDQFEAKIRAESGAAVPETEVKRLASRLAPSMLDSDQTIRVKRMLMKQFLEGTYDKFDPNGVYRAVPAMDAVEDTLKRAESAEKKGKKVFVLSNGTIVTEE